MVRKLLIITLLLSTKNAWAQNNYESYYKASSYPKALAKDEDKTDYRNLGAILPVFRVVTLPQKAKEEKSQLPGIPSKEITNKDVQNDANLFLFLFNPGCPHCESMTELLEKNIGLFKKSKILMVAAQHMGEYLVPFQNGLNINQYPQMIIGIDSSHLVDRTYMYIALPQINIYNKDRILIKRFSGETGIDSLQKYIE